MPKKEKTNQQRTPLYKRPYIVAIALIILVVIVAGVIIFFANRSQQDSGDIELENNNVPLDTQDQAVPSTKPDDSPNERPTAYEGEDPNTLEELTGSIPFKNLSDGTLSISAAIDQYLIDNGTCELTLSSDNGYNYSTSVAAVADVTTSICEPFRVDVGSFPTGTYQIKIIITGDGKTGTILDEVTL